MTDDGRPASHKFAWGFTGFFLMCAVFYASSPSVLGFLAAAVLTCPSERFRAWEPVAAIRRRLPVRAVPVVVAVLLVLSSIVARAPVFKDGLWGGGPEAGESALEDQGQGSTKSSERTVSSATDDDVLADVRLKRTTEVLEYGQGTTDATKLVSCSDPDVTVGADWVDLSRCGKQRVTYTLTRDDEIRQVTKTFTVRDTKEPKIVLASRSVEVDVGTSFDPYAVVSSVADPVDGALERLEEEPQEDGNGWYTMRGSYDPAVPGTYHLTLVACDRNGNRATKGINVIVRSSSSADPSEEEALDYVLNSNTGRFHRPSCGDAAAVSEGNRIDVHLTRDEVLAMGYAPCRHCNP